MERVPEPELMEDPVQALAYTQADFSASHGRRVQQWRDCFPQLQIDGAVLDLGCGSGDVLLRFARALPRARFIGVDGSGPMLELARRQLALEPAALATRVELVRAIIPAALPTRPWQLVMSHSLLHQLHRPEVLWRTILEQVRPGTAVFVADLRRPASRTEAQRLVDTDSAGEPPILRRDYFNSLCAAFEPQEVQAQLQQAGIDWLHLGLQSPSHLLVYGTAPRG